MSPATQARELAAREGDGIQVTLLWHPDDDALTVSVEDTRAERGFDLAVAPEHASDLIRLGREIKWALDDHPAAQLEDARVSGVYGTILFDDLGRTDDGPWQRNVTVFADGEVDRSPCGSGTSARCAQLHAEGAMGEGDVLRHESIVGTTFLARIVGEGPDGVVTEVEGTAFRTGEHRFLLDPDDPLGTGFVLR